MHTQLVRKLCSSQAHAAHPSNVYLLLNAAYLAVMMLCMSSFVRDDGKLSRREPLDIRCLYTLEAEECLVSLHTAMTVTPL